MLAPQLRGAAVEALLGGSEPPRLAAAPAGLGGCLGIAPELQFPFVILPIDLLISWAVAPLLRLIPDWPRTTEGRGGAAQAQQFALALAQLPQAAAQGITAVDAALGRLAGQLSLPPLLLCLLLKLGLTQAAGHCADEQQAQAQTQADTTASPLQAADWKRIGRG